MDAHRVHDGEVPVEADGDEDEGRQVESKRPTEHHKSTGQISSLPCNSDVPHCLQGEHDEGDDQIGYREMHDEGVNTRFETPTSEQGHKDDKISGCSDYE